jgi:hypothetical protein
MAGSVTPWLTSSESTLTAQRPVPLVDGIFSYTIPPRAIVTFVGFNSPETAGR